MANDSENYDKFWELLEGIKVCMAVTLDDDQLVSRPLSGQTNRDENSIYFVTKISEQENGEIKYPKKINLSYIHPDMPACVSVSGHVHLLNDRAKLEEIWDNHAKLWFPKGIDDPEVALLKVIPDQATYWNISTSMIEVIWEFAKSRITQNQPRIGEKIEIDLPEK